VRLSRCLEDEGEVGSGDAGSAGALGGPAILIPSFLGYQGGGGPTQGTGFRIMELLGPHHTRDTHTHGTAIDNTDDSSRK